MSDVMELLEVGRGYLSKTENGLIIKIELPTSIFITVLTCNKQDVKDVLDGKKQEFKISLLGEQ
jgi:hypothetical protein